MKNGQKIDLGLTGYDELFMTDQERQENRLPKIYDIPLSEIDDFPDHPFKVRLDEDMDQLVQSVKDRGIIVPIRARFGKRAITYAALLGNLKMPCDGSNSVKMPSLRYQ